MHSTAFTSATCYSYLGHSSAVNTMWHQDIGYMCQLFHWLPSCVFNELSDGQNLTRWSFPITDLHARKTLICSISAHHFVDGIERDPTHTHAHLRNGASRHASNWFSQECRSRPEYPKCKLDSSFLPVQSVKCHGHFLNFIFIFLLLWVLLLQKKKTCSTQMIVYCLAQEIDLRLLMWL